MSRCVQGAVLAVAGVGLFFVWPPAATGLTVAGLYVGSNGVRKFSSVGNRALWIATIAMHVGVVAAASGSWFVATAPLPYLILMTPSAWMTRRFGYRLAEAVAPSLVLGAGILIVSWPPTPWWLTAIVVFAHGTRLSLRSATMLKRIATARPSAWKVELGAVVPEIQLPSRNEGAPFQLTEERGRFVLLYFLRGDWCPMCQVMMRVLKREAPRLAERDVKVVVVSPGSGQEANDFARALGLDYTVLVDPDHETAKIFGALDAEAYGGKGAPLLSAFLIDPDGLLRYASNPSDVDSFLDPADVLQIVEAAA